MESTELHVVTGAEQVYVVTVKPYARDLAKLLEESDPKEQEGFIRSFGQRTDVGRNQATVN